MSETLPHTCPTSSGYSPKGLGLMEENKNPFILKWRGVGGNKGPGECLISNTRAVSTLRLAP